ncbi:helix-turn-helix domain-containing protein [Amycolatopsis samaneae]|uniref:Helix-turn-helix domain-containing protein n=1 Tax=Amycolatopsis samaneae TaxID=664691 RepID=A0ABW5GKD1_9PSEU
MPRLSRPSFPRRQVGRTLRRLRERTGMTQEAAGEPIRISGSKLSRIEQGHIPGYNDFLALLDRYGVLTSDYDHYVRLYDLAKQARWWPSNPRRNFGYVDAEDSASLTSGYQTGLVPGILQTKSYARGVFEFSGAQWSSSEVEQLVSVRERRQRRLFEQPTLAVHFVVDESTLIRRLCDRAQLEQLVELSALPNVTVQVAELSAPPHGGFYASFVVLDYPDPEEFGLVYVEFPFGSDFIENVNEVREAKRQFKMISKFALDENDSVELIKRLIVEKGR